VPTQLSPIDALQSRVICALLWLAGTARSPRR
jgi:hypothetical protein